MFPAVWTVLVLSLLGAIVQAHSPASAPGPGSLGGADTACCNELSAINFNTTLPVLIVNTLGNPVAGNSTTADICTCGADSNANHGGDYSGTVQFGTRGGSNTQSYNKILQYKVKLPKNSYFMGMPKGKSWIIYGQQNDTFGLHQWLGFNISRATGEYAARTQHHELFIIDDGTPLAYPKHYHGLYLAIESPSQDNKRIMVSKTGSVDDTGGYIVEFSHSGSNSLDQNPKGLPTVNGTLSTKQWLVKYPKKPTPAELNYLQGYLNQFESALYGPTFADPTTGWRKFANSTTFVDWFLTTELVKNAKHSYHSSAYMHKDADKPFEMGPSWNQVEGFGQCCGYPFTGYNNDGISGPGKSGGSAVSPNGWLFDICDQPERCTAIASYDAGDGIAVWFDRLWKDQSWITANAQRYQSLRTTLWNSATYQALIAEKQANLQDAGMRTLQKWSSILYQPQYFPTMEDQYNNEFTSLSNWTLTRLAWMDGALQQAAVSQAEAQTPFATVYPPTNPTAMPPAGPPTTGGVITAG